MSHVFARTGDPLFLAVPREAVVQAFREDAPRIGTRSAGIVFKYLPSFLATLAEQVASRRTDPSSASDLFFRAGELWAKNVGRHDKAVGNYRRAYELDPTQIQAIEAAGKYAVVHVGKENHVLRETMSSLESCLPPQRFWRIIRSVIINIDQIRELHQRSRARTWSC
jgi:DNA-binding LytR/AlgR family response regulator